MTKGERIKFLRDKMGLSQVSLADKINVSKQTLYKYENDIITNIPSDKVELIAEATGSTPAYIMGWEDSPIPSYSNIRPIAKKRLPVLGSVACGEPIYMAEEKEVYVDTTTEVKADFILIAKGDSMTGARINDGDLVFVRQQPEVENGDIAVVAIDDEATLKRFYKYNDMILLKAENPEYKDMVYTPEDHKEVRVLGKAVAFQSDVR